MTQAPTGIAHMNAQPETFLATLDQGAKSAKAEEAEFRASYATRVAQLERTRVLAFRRLHLMRAVTQAIEGADNEEEALARAKAACIEALNLDRRMEKHMAVAARFTPVAEAIDEAVNCEGEPDHQAVLTALTAFETWYEGETGQSVYAILDVYVPETPVVDF